MGAGSAKGIGSSPEDDADIEDDRFSVLSRQTSPTKGAKKTHKSNTTTEFHSSTQDLSLDLSDDDEYSTIASSGLKTPEKKEEKKRGGGLFGFSRKKDDEEEEKTSAFVHEEGETKPSKGEKKEKGFKLFTWKKDEKKSEEKDETLDQEINDLHRTFDSLGIEAKSSWEGQKEVQKKSQSADDIRKLSPMRNRVKPRTLRTSHSRRNNDSLGSTAGSGKKNIKYSWETAQNPTNSLTDEDQWSYKAVVIDGFDIEKFKRANFEDGSIETRIPNSVMDDNSPPMSPSRRGASPLTYDTTEQKLLSTIERDFGF